MPDSKEEKESGFSYVDIATKGCEGWLNLFFYGEAIAMINNLFLADKIRREVRKKEKLNENNS